MITPDPVGPGLRWPEADPQSGAVRLRAFRADDIAMIRDLATDPYVPTIGSLPAGADPEQAAAFIERQLGRLAEGAGFSFCVADRESDTALGTAGLWTRNHLTQGRATVGYAVAPAARGRHVARDALRAVTAFGWTISGLHRIEAYVEPWNLASQRTAAQAGYVGEGLLRSHQEIAGQRCDMLLYAAIRPVETDQNGA